MSRRFVLAGTALATASLLVPISTRPARAQRSDDADYEIADWILIAANGQVTLGLSQPEVGQGSYTALPQILADELDADWERVKVRFVTGRAAYKIAFRQEAPAQKEGASMSTTALYQRLRTAGAAARDVLVRAAAQRWNIAASDMPHRERFRHQRTWRAARLWHARVGCRQAAAQRDAAVEGPESVSSDRQAGGTTGYAGQVQRQRGVRYRRRGAGNAERRDQDRAFLQRPGDGRQERGRYSQDARRPRGGEDRGAGDRQRGRRLPASAPSAFAPPQRGVRRGRSFLAGQARTRCARRGVRRRQRGRSFERQDRRHAGGGPRYRTRRHGAGQRRADADPAGASRLDHRAALRTAAHRACATRAGQRDGELPERRRRDSGDRSNRSPRARRRWRRRSAAPSTT